MSLPNFQSLQSYDQLYETPQDWLLALGEDPTLAQSALNAASHASRSPGDFQWPMVRALAYWNIQKFDEGFRALLEVDSSSISSPDFFGLFGMLARRIPGQEAKAEEAYLRSLELNPSRSDIYYNLANLLREKSPERASDYYLKSLRLDPKAAVVWHNYGAILNENDHHIASLLALKTSLRLNPYDADAWCNLGLTLFQLEKFTASKACFVHAIGLDKTHAQSHVNYGQVLIETLEPEEALRYMKRGVELDNSSFNSLWNLSLALLLLGHYDEGWRFYEARFHTKDLGTVVPPTPHPQERQLEELPSVGEPELIVWSEQGLGDSIQFVRYLKLLEARNVPFRFLAHKPLVSLYRDWFNLSDRVTETLSKGDDGLERCPNIPLLSLPHLFRTELHTIPSLTPYLHRPGPTPSHLRLKSPPGGFSVGVVWATNPDNKAMYRNKSIPASMLLSPFVKLVDLQLVNLHSLQVGPDSSDLEPFLGSPGLHDWGDTVKDFSETAFLIDQLDLVVTVDTAVAHLAGALNKPTWLLLAHNADFRWLYKRADSPWYPKMRLFRQPRRGDWSGLMDNVQEALNQLFLLDLPRLSESKSL